MEFFRIKRDIPFMKNALVFNIISLITFLAAVFFLVNRGLHFSIEFTGGTVMEVKYEKPAEIDKIRSVIEGLGYTDSQVQTFGTSQDVLIRLPIKGGSEKEKSASTKQSEQVMAALQKAEPGVKLQRVEFVGPQVGKELAQDGALALLVVVIGIMIYLAFRFEWKFAVAAIIANLHDVVIILGFFAFFQWEFSLSVLAGILAVLGYSVNESVVVADRIRENFKKMRVATVDQVIDNAITSTISRTVITHGTTETMVIFMLLFGGPTLHYFALALTIGIVFGIYSSVLVMAPITRWLGVKREDLVKPIKKKAENDGAVV
jgi:preprotein translocase subunit SecF